MTRLRRCALVLSALVGLAAQAAQVPGTQTYYSAQSDPITDVNTGFVNLYEVNDLYGDTALTVRCSNFDAPDLWLALRSKHEIVNPYSTDSDGLPAITIRLGTDAPIVLPTASLNTVVNSQQEPNAQALAIQGGYVRQIIAGLNAGKRLVVRINRESGGQALTYTFSPNGFPIAWSAVNQCQATRVGSVTLAPPSAPATTAGAPKFTKWYFTTCRDVGSGAVRAGLVAGRAHLCDLVIETVPNGAVPVSAEFRYELEYRENGAVGKLTLDAVDTWPRVGSGPVTAFRQSGSQLVFTLPLNVRVRAERVYTSINVTAVVRFSNGSSKRVYEPLAVRLY